MKTFVKHILKIVLMLFVCAYMLDFGFTYVYRNSIPRTKFQYLRMQKNKNFDYIFLGSSRVENGVVANLIEEKTGKKTINLALQGSNLSDVYFIQQLLLEYKINCKKVFIQVDEAFYTPNDFSINVKYESMPFINENSIISDFNKLSDKKEFWKNTFLPFYRYNRFSSKIGFREFVASLLNIEKYEFIKDKGYFPLTENFKKNELDFAKPMHKNNFLDSIIRFNKQNKIDCVFYMAPYKINTKKELSYLKNISNDIPNHYNFSNILQNDIYFKDSYHLNHKGAVAFTNILIEKLKL